MRYVYQFCFRVAFLYALGFSVIDAERIPRIRFGVTQPIPEFKSEFKPQFKSKFIAQFKPEFFTLVEPEFFTLRIPL